VPIKKSDLYSSLWAPCDELRGGMDASQYKDYVLFMLFIKYITDKYGNSNDFAPPVTINSGMLHKRSFLQRRNVRRSQRMPIEDITVSRSDRMEHHSEVGGLRARSVFANSAVNAKYR
jgi:hypothetical protein